MFFVQHQHGRGTGYHDSFDHDKVPLFTDLDGARRKALDFQKRHEMFSMRIVDADEYVIWETGAGKLAVVPGATLTVGGAGVEADHGPLSPQTPVDPEVLREVVDEVRKAMAAMPAPPLGEVVIPGAESYASHLARASALLSTLTGESDDG